VAADKAVGFGDFVQHLVEEREMPTTGAMINRLDEKKLASGAVMGI